MVRTYTWNPSTQSSLTIIGNFNNEDEKTVTNPLPTTSTNFYPTQCFSNGSICRPNCKNGQVTDIPIAVPKDGTQNVTTSTSSEILSAGNSHIQCPVHMLQSQTASLRQSHHQSFPVYYPIPLDLSANFCQWRPHLFPPQVTTPIMFERATNIRPVDLWHLRPIQIGSKVYYEPVSSSPAFYDSPASIVPHTVTSANLVTIPNTQFENVSSFHCQKSCFFFSLIIT